MRDRSHDTYWPEGLTLLTSKNGGNDWKADSRQALTSRRATEDKILSTLNGDRVTERLLLKRMELEILNIRLRYEGEGDSRVGKRRDYGSGGSVMRRLTRRQNRDTHTSPFRK
jgi:hypothetical protein